MRAVSIDGAVVPPEAARISVFDRGLLYGDGCFEVLRTWEGVAVDLAAHLDRLYATAEFLRLRALDRAALETAVARTIAAAGPGDHRIRIVLTRGEGSLAQPFATLGPGSAIVIVEPLPPIPSSLSVAVVDWPIAHAATRSPGGHKTLAYLDPLIARELARAAGADEAIRLDPGGHVVEGATCNVFAVTRGQVATPRLEEGALPGIVRSRVLSLCAATQLGATERVIAIRELQDADELFVTSSLRGVVAVTCLDGVPKAAGPITAQLSRAYVQAMRPGP